MEYYEINGGRRLTGQVVIHGAKNSVLPLLWRHRAGPMESAFCTTAPASAMWRLPSPFCAIWAAG